ncbi:MAG: VOC family protein [Actinomycetota bacterium]
MDIEIATVVFDCSDPKALSEFWESATGLEVADEEDDWVLLADPEVEDGGGIQLGFQLVPERKSVKNRLHLDLYAHGVEETAEWMQSLGAVRLWVSDDPDDIFITLADPEGNEFCVVEAAPEDEPEDEPEDVDDADDELLLSHEGLDEQE